MGQEEEQLDLGEMPLNLVGTKMDFDQTLEDLMSVDLHDESSAHQNSFFKFMAYKLGKLNIFKSKTPFTEDVRGFIVDIFQQLPDREKADILLSYRSMLQLGKNFDITDDPIMVEVGLTKPNISGDVVIIPVMRDGHYRNLYLRNLASQHERERQKIIKERKEFRVWLFKTFLGLLSIVVIAGLILGLIPGVRNNILSRHLFEFLKTIWDLIDILFFKSYTGG